MSVFTLQLRTFFYCLLLVCLFGCGGKKQQRFISPPEYNFADPVVITLRNDLDEISGIQFYTKDSSLFAINDEQGVLFKIHLRQPIKIDAWKFGSAGDYEDILLTGTTFCALHSNGAISAFGFAGDRLMPVGNYLPELKGDNEFEAFYLDSVTRKLMLVCKACSEDKKHVRSAFAFDTESGEFESSPGYAIDTKAIAKMSGRKRVDFKPSAAALHPLSGELFVLSAIDNTLAVLNRNKQVVAAYELNPQIFKQPEGISFSPSGTLFISNEAAGSGSANVLMFPYKPIANEER